VVLTLLRYHGFTPQRAGSPPDRVGRPAQPCPQQCASPHPGLDAARNHRWFGLRQLRIDSAAGGPSREEARALRELAPLARRALRALVQHLLPNCIAGRRRNGSPSRSVAGGGCAQARCCWCRCWQRPRTGAGDRGPIVLAWLPVALLVAHRQMARMGWYLDAHYVAVRGGWWKRWWRWAELDKVQGLRLQRSPLDKLLGTSSLQLDTAGAHGDVALTLRQRRRRRRNT
jgi:putative membrane protein